MECLEGELLVFREAQVTVGGGWHLCPTWGRAGQATRGQGAGGGGWGRHWLAVETSPHHISSPCLLLLASDFLEQANAGGNKCTKRERRYLSAACF